MFILAIVMPVISLLPPALARTPLVEIELVSTRMPQHGCGCSLHWTRNVQAGYGEQGCDAHRTPPIAGDRARGTRVAAAQVRCSCMKRSQHYKQPGFWPQRLEIELDKIPMRFDDLTLEARPKCAVPAPKRDRRGGS